MNMVQAKVVDYFNQNLILGGDFGDQEISNPARAIYVPSEKIWKFLTRLLVGL